MEKGEIGILAGQFLTVLVVLFLLSGFVPINAVSTPTITSVYWGPPSDHIGLTKLVTNTEKTNASTITVYFALASGTNAASLGATRLCNSNQASGRGEYRVYTDFPVNYTKGFFTIGPTGQSLGETCTYTLQLTDSLQQVATWVGEVEVTS